MAYHSNPELDRAFNLGADSRLAGVPADLCPYHGDDNRSLRDAWENGWRHVQAFYGCDVPAHLRRRLPEVREMAS